VQDNMPDILTAKVLTIGECGQNEYWLRDKIYDDPSMLGLGDLQPVSKERTQSQGGRLDLLLKDPEDNSMFEVELQQLKEHAKTHEWLASRLSPQNLKPPAREQAVGAG